jgi:prepilin-type N-terminal cleavage/methylation domain-containing protein/prepilin-type processing-associated H-X9-DG protein
MRSYRSSGLTLIELLVVLAIISVMLSFLFPAIQRARESANRMMCQNNLRQLTLAMRGYVEVHRSAPFPAQPDRTGGWSIAILPFMEQKALEQTLRERSLSPPERLPHQAFLRPPVMTCPSSLDRQSLIPPIPTSHYLLEMGSDREAWRLADAHVESASPWLVGPEIRYGDLMKKKGPHSGGFNLVQADGSVRLKMP